MRYWLCLSTIENWNIIRKQLVWGVARRSENKIKMVKVDDKLLIYRRQRITPKEKCPPAIVGIFNVVSNLFEDDTPIFVPPDSQPKETFPLRVKIEPVIIFKDPVDFRTLVPDMQFIKNKQHWSSALQGHVMREVPVEDYTTIIARGQ